MTIISIIILFTIVIISITFHEYAHGLVAAKLGDPTAKQAGRLTLNPLAHIDLFGTILLPLLLAKTIGLPFGYAKPVPINPYHFKNPKKDIMWVGLAGPAANLTIALVLTTITKVLSLGLVANILFWAITINLALAVFNLIPIPPLDGSKIIAAFLPTKLYYNYLRLQIYGYIVILLLIFSGLLDWFILPVVRTLLYLLGLGGIL